MRKKDHLTFQRLIQSEKEKIMNNPQELDKIYDKLDSRLSITPSKQSRV
ncbi:FbpB family small basic protein [Alkalibacillus almallahensis]|nr:FbpB family small basic protein [Alkalibacillus almallahensis]NIK10967.1 hypothetical protein [Alkalibacillus almallahensis]